MLFAPDEGELEGNLGQQGVDRLVVLRVLTRPEGVKADGAEHCAGVHIDVAEFCGQTPRQCRFACARRPVDRNRYHFSISFYINTVQPLRHGFAD